MSFILVKLLLMVLVLFLLSLPFLPCRLKFTLFSGSYDKKRSWRNVAFVLETMLLGGVLLCVAPLLKGLCDWFFQLKLMQWATNLLSDRAQYMVEAIGIVVLNFVLGFLFVIAKKIFRAILDKTAFREEDPEREEKKRKKKKKKKSKAEPQEPENQGKRKDLRKLRRESVLVFAKGKKNARVEGVNPKDYEPKENPRPIAKRDEDDPTIGGMVRRLWFAFIGLFYDKESGYAYVKPGTYRWAKQLNIFVTLFAAVYLVLGVLMQIPVFFPLEKNSFLYKFGVWFLSNAYVCPVIALAFLCELLWFLDGEYQESGEAEAPFVSFMDRVKEDEETSLTKARESILSKHGANYKIRHFEASELGGTGTYRLEEKKKAIQSMAKAIRAKNGYVNTDYMQAVEYMLEGKHVLFDTVLYSSLGDYVLHYLFVTLTFGTRALFICKDKREVENVTAYLQDSFRKITKTAHILWRICDYEKLHEGEKPDVLLLTPEEFLEPTLFTDGKRFFDELVDVFVLDADSILTANNYYCLIMAKKLEKATTHFSSEAELDADQSLMVEKRIRYRFFTSGHIQSVENSIRQFFNLENAPLEVFHSFALANRTEVFVWHTGITSALYVDNGANQVPLELQIAKDAAGLGITDINLVSSSAIYSNQRNEISGLNLNHCNLSGNTLGYVIVADDGFNLPNAIYNYARFSGRQASVLHVVSKPYLLRDYFTAQAEKYVANFELIGRTMSEHAQIRRANVLILLCDAVSGIERTVFMRRAAALLGEAGKEMEDTPKALDECVRLCYRAAFGEDSAYEPQYSLQHGQNSQLEEKTFVYLKDSDHLFEKLLECTKTVKLEYINTQGVEYLPVFRDEITQHFIPGQVLVRNNRGYTIKEMSVEEGTLVLDDTVPSLNVPMDYIQTRFYTVNSATLVNSSVQDIRAKETAVTSVAYRVYQADITADTLGYYSIEKAMQTVDLVKPNFAKYVNLQGDEQLKDQLRRNVHTNLLELELRTAEAVDARTTYLLAVMLQEFMKTVFPHQYRCVSVCPIFDEAVEEQLFANEIAIRDMYPRIRFTPENAPAEENGGSMRIAVVEDVQGGNGVVETLTDGTGIMLYNLLHVAADFLSWLHTPAGAEYKYLNFGYEKTPEVFDFEGLEKLISQFRQQVERSDLVRTNDENRCFFCHKHLDEGKGQRLEDGRLICDKCRETTVDTYESLEKIFDQAVSFLKENTSVADTLPEAKIDFVSTLELRNRYGQDAQRLPIAYCDHMNSVIYVEYGLPKSTVYGCIARGITELWQDLNVVDDGGELFRAHPDYVEIQVLSGMHMDTEAELLADFYRNNAGLEALKKALQEKNETDSFAYFLGASGKKGKPQPEEPQGDILSFISERNPEGLVKVHYARLNEDEQAVYDQIYKAVSEFAERTGPLVREVTKERCFEIMNAVIYDNAEIFWCARGMGAVSYNSAGIAVDVIFKYCMTPSEAKNRKKKIEAAIKPFLTGITPSMSDYQVALHAHENIVSLIDYDSIGLKEQEQDPNSDEKPDDLRSIYGVFVEKKAVCAGYAKAFQYITNRLGIECSYVRGCCNDGEWHAWNIIKLEGSYYYVDTTWDDHTNTDTRKNNYAEVSYDYFCITTKELLCSRNIQNAEKFPDCASTQCNYFHRSQLYFENYDAQRLKKAILAGLKAGKTRFSFKCKDGAVMKLIHTRLIKERGLMDILNSSEMAKSSYTIGHYFNEDVNVIHISVQ